MSEEGDHFYVNTPGDVAHVDQRFAEIQEYLRRAFLDDEASYAIYIFNPNEEGHEDAMLENVKIGKIHPLAGALFWTMLFGTMMEGMERWAELAAKEWRERGEDG